MTNKHSSSSPFCHWIDSAAICWNNEYVRKNNICYWSKEIIDLFRPLCDNDENDFNVDNQEKYIDDEIFSTSYETLFLLAAGVIQQMQEDFAAAEIIYSNGIELNKDCDDCDCNGEDLRNKDTATSSGVTIAVAIPEGPMLPLSVLVVHALNYIGFQQQTPPSLLGENGLNCYAVLVPIDPEGNENNILHILNDVRPSFVLAVPGKDTDKLQEMIDQYHQQQLDQNNDNNNDKNCKTIPASSNTRLLNFVNLVQVARRNLLSLVLSSSELPLNTQRISRKKFYSQLVGVAIDECKSTSLQQILSQLTQVISVYKNKNSTSYSDEESNKYQPKDCDNHLSSSISPSPPPSTSLLPLTLPKISHIVYTSGTTGLAKGCVSSTPSLLNYIEAKNQAHNISIESIVLLASSLSFDPCLSDIIATFHARANLVIAPHDALLSSLTTILQQLKITHILCTPTLWSLTLLNRSNDSATHMYSQTIMNDFPYLQRIALGGEPIPKSLINCWARSARRRIEEDDKNEESSSCRLLATYGVTEACVYQYCGEVFRDTDITRQLSSSGLGQYVGHPLYGTRIRICNEKIQGSLEDVSETGMHGEIVLFGEQVDINTGYLHRLDLRHKFVAEEVIEDDDFTLKTLRFHYRTGDRGYISQIDGSLTILDRIAGEEGMIKINGVRVELGEIEAALMTDEYDVCPVVLDCLARVVKEANSQSIHAYCTLSDIVWKELGISSNDVITMTQGIIINCGPLWTLLRKKCSNRLKSACIPTIFVGIRQLPLSRTGKRDRSGLPDLDSCDILNISRNMSTPLKDYGLAGEIVAKTLVEYLNLQRCQQQMLTKAASFAMLGGDSLSATVICRTLYAHLNHIKNSRWIGGGYGQLPEPFNTTTLLRARNLGEYVDVLDKCGLQEILVISTDDLSLSPTSSTDTVVSSIEVDDTDNALLYDALLQATTLGQSSISAALLCLKADPNYGLHGGRIGKTSGRIEQRAIFKANPLHLACFNGDTRLVKLLLDHGANYRSPNSNGLFPIHLCCVLDGIDSTDEEDKRRLKCVQLLLNAGCPLLMKDANKQTVLHAAARAGHLSIIDYVIIEFKSSYVSGKNEKYRGAIDGPPPPSHFINFYDRWFRTAVHWATLNGRTRALKLLLDHGCDPTLVNRKTNKFISLVTETPLEICRRLHGKTDKGNKMEDFLTKGIRSNRKTQFKLKNAKLN